MRWLVARGEARLLLTGALVGTVILGAGGRIAMALIQAGSGTTPPRFTPGGTLTVVGLGAASGFAGAAIALACRWLARWLPRRFGWSQYVVLAGALLGVTLHGLRGTAPVGHLYFIPLVGAYAAVMLWLDHRWTRRLAPAAGV